MPDTSDIYVITLVVEGYTLNFDRIAEGLNLKGGNTERRGEQSDRGRVYQLDRWTHNFPVAAGLSPAARLRWLRTHLQPASSFLHDLRAKADIRLIYTAYTFGYKHQALFDREALALCVEMDIPLEIKFIKFDPPLESLIEDFEATTEGAVT
jgi:hypothetical protein